MEDFEYSVEISDRDWECFFAECEECNLLSPSLAGLDSGMSDIDDAASNFAKRVQRVDVTAGSLEGDHPIDDPPDSEGSPGDHYLSQHCIGGMESILSGSEEDIHLQSVNMFFERLKNATDAERLIEPSQVSTGKNKEAILEEEKECCSDGKEASTTLPKNIPNLNSPPARGETAVGKVRTKSGNTISNIMKMVKKDEPSNISKCAASNSGIKTSNSTHPETKLFIIEEALPKTRVNEASQRSQYHDSVDGVETAPPAETCTPLDDVKQTDLLTSQSTLSKKCSPELLSSLEVVADVKWTEDATTTNKTTSQESSPSGAMKRKRRKKRRLEPAESVHGYDRQVLFKPSDSEEEQYAWRGGRGLPLSENMNPFYLNQSPKNVMASPSSITLPVKIPEKEIKVYNPSHCNPPMESIVFQSRCKAADLYERIATNNGSFPPLKQTDEETHSQPCSKLHIEKPRLNKHPALSVLITDVMGESDLTTETANCGRKDTRVEIFQQTRQTNNYNICQEKEKLCTPEVKSSTPTISQSSESSGPIVEVGQNEKLSVAKSVLAEEAGDSGRGKYTLCYREAEPQQQLEIDRHQYSFPQGKTHCTCSADGINLSETRNAKNKQYKTGARPLLEETSSQVNCELDNNNSMPPSSLDINIPVQQTELHTLSTSDALTTTMEAELPASQIQVFHNGNLPGEIRQTGQSLRDSKLSMSEDLLTSPSDMTPVSSCSVPDTASLMSLSNENITDMPGSDCISVSQNDSEGQGEKASLILAKHQEGDLTCGSKSNCISNDTTVSKSDIVLEAEKAITSTKEQCESEKAPDSKNSVFAMSSFWSEMEKITINDILGLRMINKAVSPDFLPPFQESEQTGVLALPDSAFLTQMDESRPEQTSEVKCSDQDSVESSTVSVTAGGVVWESEPVHVNLSADIYTENLLLTSVSDISQPTLPGSPQTCFRNISKNVSVHNLHALETLGYTCKRQTLQTVDEGQLEKVESSFIDGHMPKKYKDVDSIASSVTDGYRISLTDIFHYLFGGTQSNPSQSTTENITAAYTDGNSVPETYDHFFSEFDTENFFCPLITAEDQDKDEMIPILSYCRSANKNLQFPEAYDYFFASSSSDDSSEDSDEEEPRGPVRVVTRFRRTSSVSKISTDIYDNFFTDKDLRQNFFWKNTLSFRNLCVTGSTVQKLTLSNPLVPVKPSGKSLQRAVHPINALGNQDMVFYDPRLYDMEDRISTQLAQQHLRCEDLQMAVSNPRLDAPLLPLRQSDMCLVCIAFASWVLKTANPQVGDAWKAVLLANVSALSAIGYLRKYVKMEAEANQKKLPGFDCEYNTLEISP